MEGLSYASWRGGGVEWGEALDAGNMGEHPVHVLSCLCHLGYLKAC